jgi:hypothetical protein
MRAWDALGFDLFGDDMKIAIGNRKGGVGTSILACNTSAAFAAVGNSVLLVDTDRSRTTTGWYARRHALALEPSLAIVTAPRSTVAALDDPGPFDIRLVDVWRYHEDMAALAGNVNFWLAPCMASRPDLDVTLRLYEMLTSEVWRFSTDRVPFSVVLTQTPNAPGSQWEAYARSYLKEQAPNLHVFEQSLHSRRAWHETHSGHALFELPNRVAGKALAEFTSFLKELTASLHATDTTRPATG